MAVFVCVPRIHLPVKKNKKKKKKKMMMMMVKKVVVVALYPSLGVEFEFGNFLVMV